MEDNVKKELEKEDMTPFHVTMLEECKKLVKLSRDVMSKYYDGWDTNDEIYRGERQQDTDDKKASERKEPVKMVVPITQAQVQTFVAFGHSMLLQRDKFFELTGFGEDDHKPAAVGEALLQRDLDHNNWPGILHQFLLDLGRFGLAVTKDCWVHDTQMIEVVEEKPAFSMFGLQFMSTPKKLKKRVTKYMGNKIVNVSPYKFFPDVRLPITRFQEGEFVASEDEFSYIDLKRQEANGQVAGIKWIKDKQLSREALKARGSSRLVNADVEADLSMARGNGQSKGVYLVTEIQRWIVPKDFEIDGKPMGEEDYPVLYVIQYVNDTRIIKCEPMGYAHNEFTFGVAQFTPDMHHTVNQGLAEKIDSLQSVISWFINSRITSVRKVIDNKLIVDAESLNMEDIQERKPIVRTKPGGNRGQGVDKLVYQLQVQDVTTRHIEDAKYLNELVRETTGVSENALGQFHGGRRSATEARNVNSASAARLRMVVMLAYYSAMCPMGRRMLSNLREGLDETTFVNLVGMEEAFDGAKFLEVSKEELTGNYDFEMFDGTLPSERAFIAQVLEELLKAFMSNPEVAIALQMDPREMLLEAMRLRGVRNPKRFTLKQIPPEAAAMLENGQTGQTSSAPRPGAAPSIPADTGTGGAENGLTYK